MATRRIIKSVLHNFLGTYTSRYTDYGGYWLFGFLVADLNELHIDLLSSVAAGQDSPRLVAFQTAFARFDDQMQKVCLPRSSVSQANLLIRRLAGIVEEPVNGRPSAGYKVQFTAAAVMDNAQHFERTSVVFVAPHNPAVESCSNLAV